MAAVKNISIRIPIFDRGAQDAVATHVVFYPDEIPEDSQILLDVLKAALAPLKVWNICAVSWAPVTMLHCHSCSCGFIF